MLKKKKDKKILETKGVKVNFKKRTLKLPEKALKILETNIKGKISTHGKDGTYVISDIGTYTKNGSKEICYRNAYLSKDYLIFPLSVDNIKVPKILDKDEIEVIDEEVETIKDNKKQLIRDKFSIEDIQEVYEDIEEAYKDVFGSDIEEDILNNTTKTTETKTGLQRDPNSDNLLYNLLFNICNEETLYCMLEENDYFLYNYEIFVKIKSGNGFSPRRFPDMKPLTSLIDTKKVNIQKLEVNKIILLDEQE